MGYGYFGESYAQNLYKWILKNYERESLIGAEPHTGKGFGILILKKQEDTRHVQS